jgi:hypothetical protein
MELPERLQKALEHWGGGVMAFQAAMVNTGVSQGATYPAIKRYLDGAAEPSLEWLRMAAGILGVRFAWLATDDGEMLDSSERIRAELDDPVTVLYVELEKLLTVVEGDLPISLHPLFATAALRYIDTAADLDQAADPIGDTLRAAQHLRDILLTPLGQWGFAIQDKRRFEDYCMAMLHALMIAMAESREGQPLNELPRKEG